VIYQSLVEHAIGTATYLTLIQLSLDLLPERHI